MGQNVKKKDLKSGLKSIPIKQEWIVNASGTVILSKMVFQTNERTCLSLVVTILFHNEVKKDRCAQSRLRVSKSTWQEG